MNNLISKNSELNREGVSKTSSCLSILNSLMLKLEGMKEENLFLISQYADDILKPYPVGIQLRLNSTKRLNSSCYCEVSIKMSDGTERPVHFYGRPSMVLYVYTLLNRNGCRRYLDNNTMQGLKTLFSKMYKRPGAEMPHLEGHALDQAVSQSRKAIRQALGSDNLCEDFMLDSHTSKNKNWLVIPFAQKGGNIESVNF